MVKILLCWRIDMQTGRHDAASGLPWGLDFLQIWMQSSMLPSRRREPGAFAGDA
jgi:hypothetical protein